MHAIIKKYFSFDWDSLIFPYAYELSELTEENGEALGKLDKMSKGTKALREIRNRKRHPFWLTQFDGYISMPFEIPRIGNQLKLKKLGGIKMDIYSLFQKSKMNFREIMDFRGLRIGTLENALCDFIDCGLALSFL